jgi:hypothetical protein
MINMPVATPRAIPYPPVSIRGGDAKITEGPTGKQTISRDNVVRIRRMAKKAKKAQKK